MDLQLGNAFKIVMKTTPYIGYRAVVYGAICGMVAVCLLLLAVIDRIFGGGAAAVLFVIGLGAGGFGARFLREYILYLLKAGHIALVTEIVQEGKLPDGVSQTKWAKDHVMRYFKEISVLALIDQLVKGIIAVVNRRLFNVLSILPLPGMDGLKKVVQRIVDFSLTYIDESILAYTFKTKNDNVYDAAKTGVVLYCQSWKALLKNAVALTILSYVFVVITTLIALIPIGAVAWMLPEAWAGVKFLLFILALFIGVSLKWIFFDPIASTATILTFLKQAETLTPDADWEARIESVSGKFRELKAKAAGKIAGETPGAEQPADIEPETQ